MSAAGLLLAASLGTAAAQTPTPAIEPRDITHARNGLITSAVGGYTASGGSVLVLVGGLMAISTQGQSGTGLAVVGGSMVGVGMLTALPGAMVSASAALRLNRSLGLPLRGPRFALGADIASVAFAGVAGVGLAVSQTDSALGVPLAFGGVAGSLLAYGVGVRVSERVATAALLAAGETPPRLRLSPTPNGLALTGWF